MAKDVVVRPTDRHVLATLRQHGELDRTELAAHSGVPRSTINDVVIRLQRAGLVVDRPAAAGVKAGRPSRRIAPSSGAPIGVIAMTHDALQVAVVGMDGEPQAVRRQECHFETDAEGLLATGLHLLESLVASLAMATSDLAGVVLGVPVPFAAGRGRAWVGECSAEPGQRVQASSRLKGPTWLQHDPSQMMAERLGVPVWVENDANLGALGEAASGAAQGMRNFVYLKIVHGIGAALVLNGQLHRGASGTAGELAHLHIYEEGPVCVCGGRGCLVTTMDTPHLVDLIQRVHHATLTMRDVLSLCEQGDLGVNRVLGDLGRTLGRSLADMCVYLNPDGIVVDGLLETASVPVISGIRAMVERYAHPRAVSDARIVAGSLPHDAELRGAAALVRTLSVQ